MDDPWGSPWADEAPGTAKKLDEARPKPIVIATEKELPFDSGPRSPWDDDHDDYEWSANLDQVVQKQRTSIIGDVDASWSYQSNGHAPVEDDEAITTQVDSPWSPNVHDAEETQKQNLQGGKEEQGFDDPWGQPDVQAEAKLSPNLAQETSDSAQIFTADSSHPNGDLNGVTDGIHPQEESRLESPIEKSLNPETSEFQDRGKESPIIEPPRHEESDIDSQENGFQPPILETPDKDAPQSSRPSSSLTQESRQDETTNDSLHTSPDGESRRIPVETRDTPKVKELVQLFDGLAVESPSTAEGRSDEDLPLASSQPTPEKPSPAESEDEFGDFEDGVSFVSASAGSDEPEAPSSPASVQPSKVSAEPIISRPVERKTFERGSVKFDIDKSIVDRLYSDKEIPPESTTYGPSDIDNPNDSHLTVEQRKVWYRISRYGTMRKHNSGDDDAYVRMGWQHSKIREKTLDIVHKWMAEGRLGAGMPLGGVGRVEAMFSWGKPGQAPNTEALPIARKASQSSKAKQPVLHTSPPRKPSHDAKPVHKRQKSSVSSIKSIVSSPVEPSPRFSWSTAQPASPDPATAITSASSDSHPESFRHEPVIPPISKAFESPSPVPVPIEPVMPHISRAFESPSPVPVPVEPLKPKPAALPAPELPKEDIPKANDDDDEWGEMVASPATPNFPDLPCFPSVLQDKNSSKAVPGFNHVVVNNKHATKHSRNASLGNQISGSIPPKPFDIDNFVPKAANRSSLGDLSKLTSGSGDAWANADFSFFETPSLAPNNATVPKHLPFASKPVPVVPKATPALHNTKAITPTLTPVPSTPPVGRKSKAELEQDKIVRDIINGLPDLSYMLR